MFDYFAVPRGLNARAAILGIGSIRSALFRIVRSPMRGNSSLAVVEPQQGSHASWQTDALHQCRRDRPLLVPGAWERQLVLQQEDAKRFQAGAARALDLGRIPLRGRCIAKQDATDRDRQ